MVKTSKWLDRIFSASIEDKKTGLRFEVRRNAETLDSSDKFLYRCTDAGNKLLFERKIDSKIALVVANGWEVEPLVKELVS